MPLQTSSLATPGPPENWLLLLLLGLYVSRITGSKLACFKRTGAEDQFDGDIVSKRDIDVYIITSDSVLPVAVC